MSEVGELRPSQLVFTFGVGALVDLPRMSGMVMGLDDWRTDYCHPVEEDRLLAAVQRRLGAQVARLCIPPIVPDKMRDDPAAMNIGVPIAPFPRWLRCILCDTMATLDSGVFELVEDRYRPDRTGFVHQSCQRASRGGRPLAVPVRFLLACREGHLTDFPWLEFVHRNGPPCGSASLMMREFDSSADVSGISVKCDNCKAERRMADAFETKVPFPCPGHHPHLRRVDAKHCAEPARTILLGASNSWFGSSLSALSIPSAEGKLDRKVEEHWTDLKETEDLDELRLLRRRAARFPELIPLFGEFDDDAIWAAIQAKRNRAHAQVAVSDDLKLPEWRALSKPGSLKSDDFALRDVEPPKGFEAYFEQTVLVDQIREVRALLGFTRIESNADFAEAQVEVDSRMTPLCREAPTWLPASEVRGEGIFLRIKEDVLQAWCAEPDVRKLQDTFLASHKAWRQQRKIAPAADGFPGIRFVLLHSLAHALMRQIVLDCGYTASSVRERIYSRHPEEPGGPMAGILIYTAAPDSEGTLGGVVGQGEPTTLGRHLHQTLESMRLCGSDPLCAENRPDNSGRTIHGACCHACQFAPETSCERANRYLDRSVLVDTFASTGLGFFR